MRQKLYTILIAVAPLLVCGRSAWAEIPEVPGDEIFGITSPTDVGNVGDVGLANEFNARFGKRNGRYRGINTQTEFGYTFAKDWWIGVSGFAAANRSHGVTGLADIDTAAFDGISFELQYVMIRRSAANPFAVALAVEPRWSRIDGTNGLRSGGYNANVKLLVDAVVVPDRIYWAANVNWVPQRAQDTADRSLWLDTSSTLLSSAVTFQLSPNLFIGAEVRHLAAFDGAGLQDRLGYAVYLGPTLAWKITDQIVFNTTWQPQISGRSSDKPLLHYDLDNFERSQFRAKLSVGLN